MVPGTGKGIHERLRAYFARFASARSPDWRVAAAP
jgi:hypothetical protein